MLVPRQEQRHQRTTNFIDHLGKDCPSSKINSSDSQKRSQNELVKELAEGTKKTHPNRNHDSEENCQQHKEALINESIHKVVNLQHPDQSLPIHLAVVIVGIDKDVQVLSPLHFLMVRQERIADVNVGVIAVVLADNVIVVGELLRRHRLLNLNGNSWRNSCKEGRRCCNSCCRIQRLLLHFIVNSTVRHVRVENKSSESKTHKAISGFQMKWCLDKSNASNACSANAVFNDSAMGSVLHA